MMRKKILVTGSDGLVGTAIREIAKTNDLYQFVFATRQDGNLTDEWVVHKLYAVHNPNYVIHTAAAVCGIGGHARQQGDLFYRNVLMNSYMVHYAYRYNVEKFIAFSSVCAFPDNLPVLTEDRIHDGPVFEGNFAYGYSKRAMDVHIQSYRMQYGLESFTSLICGNIIGPRDFYNLERGHVVPSLIHKLYLAKKEGTPFKVWGNGTAKREFIYSEDVARILMQLLEKDKLPPRILVSGEQEFTIKQIVEMLCEIAEFKGEIIWETDKPNGQGSRPTDLSVLRSLVVNLNLTSMKEALSRSYHWFVENYPYVRQSFHTY